MPYAGFLTLGDVERTTNVLVVACSRCDRAGRLPVATLIKQHGPKHTVPALLRMLSAECPKHTSLAAIYDTCGLHCPELPGFFLAKQQAELMGH